MKVQAGINVYLIISCLILSAIFFFYFVVDFFIIRRREIYNLSVSNHCVTQKGSKGKLRTGHLFGLVVPYEYFKRIVLESFLSFVFLGLAFLIYYL